MADPSIRTPSGDGPTDPSAETGQLVTLPNIGPVLAQRLAGIGVTTPAALATMGPVAAARALSTPEDPACYNTLYALAGAIAGVRWHDLPKSQRKELHDQLWADRRADDV